jgi:hypothetical protein
MQELVSGSEYSEAKFHLKFSENGRVFNSYFFSLDQMPPVNIDRMGKFFTIWRDAFQDNKLPKWKDFSFEKFLGWHSHMRAMYSSTLKEQNRTLIVGDGFKKLWGKKSLSEQIQEGNGTLKETEDTYLQYLNHMYNHHYAVSLGVIPTLTGSLQPIILLELPLSDNGHDVTHFLTAVMPL